MFQDLCPCGILTEPQTHKVRLSWTSYLGITSFTCTIHVKRGLLGKTTVHSNSIQLLRIVCEMFAMEVYTALCQGLQNGWDSNIQQFIVLLALKAV